MTPEILDDEGLQTILELDSDIHNPARMSVLMFLLPRGRATFTSIQKCLNLTSGNLSSHIKKLQTQGFVEVKKTFIDLKPTTEVYISSKGRESIIEYAKELSSIFQKMLEEKP
ncbi:MAG: transcriptional regulator [Candidatus Hodarchaeales archaeon]